MLVLRTPNFQVATIRPIVPTRWSGDVMKRPGHKNFNAVSHNRSRPEVLFFNLTWRSQGQISSVILQLLLFALSNTKFERREMICYVLAMGKQHLGPHVVVGYGIKIFWPGLFITSPDHLEDMNTLLPLLFTTKFLPRANSKIKLNYFQLFFRWKQLKSIVYEEIFNGRLLSIRVFYSDGHSGMIACLRG